MRRSDGGRARGVFSYRQKYNAINLPNLPSSRFNLLIARRAPDSRAMVTRRDIIVLDNGGSTIKVGFAGDHDPVWCVPRPALPAPPRPLAHCRTCTNSQRCPHARLEDGVHDAPQKQTRTRGVSAFSVLEPK